MTDNRDATFAEGTPVNREKVRLLARDAEDLNVISTLLQDAVGKTSEIAWMPSRRIFALVVNRFRWETADAARAEGRPFERVRTGLHFETVLDAKFRGFDPEKAQQAFELLAIGFAPSDEIGGTVTIDCAGGASFLLTVEALEARMGDMDAVWRTETAPEHKDDA